MTRSQKMVPMNPMGRPDKKDLLDLTELLEAGKVSPVIDKRYTLSELPEALRYYGKGHANGKITIAVH
jgi:NADPH:quinone reductase-like Zn-dependent oxidoreductase